MRFMVTIKWDTAAGNAVARDGTLGDIVGGILGDLKPEAAYGGLVDGGRGLFLIVNMDDASQIPALVEPWFLKLDATLEAIPVMALPGDLERAAPDIEQAVAKYG